MADLRFELPGACHEVVKLAKGAEGSIALLSHPVGCGQEVDEMHQLIIQSSPEVVAGQSDGFVVDNAVKPDRLERGNVTRVAVQFSKQVTEIEKPSEAGGMLRLGEPRSRCPAP